MAVTTDQTAKHRTLRILRLNWTLEGGTLVPALRKPFDVLARGLVGALGGSGEGKVTPLELFAAGVLGLNPDIRDLSGRAA